MAAARAWIILAGALAPFRWTEAGNVRGSGQPSDRQLSERSMRSRFNTTVPALTGCHTIRDPSMCCLHYDLRGDDRYDWEQCTPARPSEAFSSGNVCEPKCWTAGACGSGSLQAVVGACDSPPDFGFSLEYTLGQSGSTCAQQGMIGVSEAECQAASARSGGAIDALSTLTALSGCIGTSLFPGWLVWKGTRGSGEVGANTQYLCATRSFVETSPATHAPAPAPTAAPTDVTGKWVLFAKSSGCSPEFDVVSGRGFLLPLGLDQTLALTLEQCQAAALNEELCGPYLVSEALDETAETRSCFCVQRGIFCHLEGARSGVDVYMYTGARR